MHTLIAILLSMVSAISVLISEQLHCGDLIFEIAPDNEMSRAITDATAAADSIKFSHVGIIDIDSLGNINVIEATGRAGVVITPIDSFMRKATSGAIVKRLDIDYPVDSTLQRAKSYLGRGYDWWYLPDNEEIYCSELVEKSYLRSDGRAIFSTIPMKFRNEKGEMPQFWTDLFARLGEPVPEGLPGTNPTQIANSPLLRYICNITN